MNPQTPKTQVLLEASAPRKLASIDECLHALLQGSPIIVPEAPGRDVQIMAIRALPPKLGLSTREGRSRPLRRCAPERRGTGGAQVSMCSPSSFPARIMCNIYIADNASRETETRRR